MRGRTGLILILAFNAFVFTKAYIATAKVNDFTCLYGCNPDNGDCWSIGQSSGWGWKCPNCKQVLYILFSSFFNLNVLGLWQ